MEIFTTNVLLDVLILCIVSVGIAIPLFSNIHLLYPELGWNHRGNVPTSTFTQLDILGILATSLLFISNIIFLTLQPDAEAVPREFSSSEMLISGLVSQLIPVAIACGFLLPRMNVPEIFGLKSPNIGKVFLTGVIGLFAIYLCMAAIHPIITPLLENNLGEQELQAPVQMIIDAKENNPSLLVVLAFLAVIVAPICEEFVFRGYIYGTLKRYSCRIFATITSALFFAVVHGNLWSLIPLFVVGIGLALIYEISGSLWASILTHMLFNGVTTATLIFVNVQDISV